MQPKPFPYFGSKIAVASVVWSVFTDVYRYVEPFFGSGAILFARPSSSSPIFEIVNDRDGFIVNFWRAVKHDPEAVASYATTLSSTLDLTATHIWLISQKQDLVSKLESNKDYYDPEVAGLWVWGICSYISGGWCDGKGPWCLKDGVLQNLSGSEEAKQGKSICKSRLALNTFGYGIKADVNVKDRKKFIFDMLLSLSDRLKDIRILCSSWEECVTTGILPIDHPAAVFLDPPYSHSSGRSKFLYGTEHPTVAQDVGRWCKENESNTYLKIALCGYEGEHPSLSSWSTYSWSSHPGVSYSTDNHTKERIWFSPSCNFNLQVDSSVDLFNQFGL